MSLQNRFRTGDQALVREINLSLIMQRLREHTSLSRAVLADVTGLNKSTVSSLVQELIDKRLVHEVGLSSSGVGRPSMLLELNPQAGFIVSCELGVDFILVACADFAARIIWRRTESTRDMTTQQAILDRLVMLLRQATDEGGALCDGCGSLLGVGLGVPGLVERDSGTLLYAPNLKWEDVPLRAILSAAFGDSVPVYVDNEANMAALGEYFFGLARGYGEVLFISAGVGLGGAVVRSGQPYRGATGFASEFGHMTMDPDGEPCNCGNRGCWETQASQASVFRRIQRAIASGQPSVLRGDLDRLSVPLVVEAARGGDNVARQALDQVGRALGIGIASLVNALNPDRVVFGGILSLAGDFLLPAIEQELRLRALRWNADAVQIVLARHGSDACVMGGVATVVQAILLQPGNCSG